jgi:hypothetical protein
MTGWRPGIRDKTLPAAMGITRSGNLFSVVWKIAGLLADILIGTAAFSFLAMFRPKPGGHA